MKNLQLLSLAVMTAAVLMAFAGNASADYVTTTTGGPAATPRIHWVNESGHLTLQNPIANISCTSTTEGSVESHGSSATVSGNISTLTFTGCTNSWHVTILAPGSLSIESTSGHNGTLSWSGTTIDTTRFGITCVLETNGTRIGTLTGGNPATLHIEASIPVNTAASSGLCGTADFKWEGSYVTTSALYVVNS